MYWFKIIVMHQALVYLEQKPLQNITGLKMLYTYPESCTVQTLETGVLILLSPIAMPYDRETYPDAAQIVLLYADSSQTAQVLLGFVPKKYPIIWKIISELVTQEIKQEFTLTRERAFISFTDAKPFVSDSAVRISRSPSQSALEAYAALGHEASWLANLLEQNKAFCCELEGSVCFAFANYENIWEVGGVFTQPEARGQGLAARVVRTCIAKLQRHGLRSRYQVHEDNLASIAVAQHLGLEQVCTMVHWRSLDSLRN
jgi:RimJ/RimL family protein N-acetyltransferase